MQVAEPDTESSSRPHRLFWWKEALIMTAFYLVYSSTRNLFGSNRIAADGIPDHAFTNAERIITWERAIGTYHEESIQDWFLPHRTFLQFWNTYYGVAHFVVTLGVFIVLFIRRPQVFPQHRNALAVTTAVAIVGFALFPLMPPRLLDEPCPVQAPSGRVAFGGECIPSDLRGEDGFGFVDTLAEYGGPWSFDSEAMASISNQYAAMPSLHIGWSAWCVIAVWPLLRRRWSRILWLLYPIATLFCIVVTGNHYWMDGLGGLVALSIGIVAGFGLHRWNTERLDRRAALQATL